MNYKTILKILLAGSIFINLNAFDANVKQFVQPTPKVIEFGQEKISIGENESINIVANNTVEKKAVNYFEYLLRQKFYGAIEVIDSRGRDRELQLTLKQSESSPELPNDQFYSIKYNEEINSVNITSPSQLGLLYGVVTFVDLIQNEEGELFINVNEVEDYPTYQRRMFVAAPKAKEVSSLLDFALQNKFETVVIASRQFPWYEVTDEYLAILKEIKTWKDKFGGPKIMQSHNIYDGRDIIISNEEDIEALKNVIETSYNYGVEKLMVLSDDTPPFKFGEGYVLTNENDKEKFEHFEAANTYLMNNLVEWFKEKDFDIETYYVPAFYTYEEMHYGDMDLFKDTPWEEEAFAPFYRDLKYIGLNMSNDVEIVWTGKYVRSRKIAKEDVDDWTANLMGRVPFLWDNTIYSHYPFNSSPMFTAYDNDFPSDFDKITSANGIFINGNAWSEDTKATVITVNDYLWNPSTYEPAQSIERAMNKVYGSELAKYVNEFKTVELELKKKIGERELYFESDSLWKMIRKVRYIHTKNPFKYHFNYTRMKALRLQLKGSVPVPGLKKEFIEECKAVANKRDEILNKIKEKDNALFYRLTKIITPLPDFGKID